MMEIFYNVYYCAFLPNSVQRQYIGSWKLAIVGVLAVWKLQKLQIRVFLFVYWMGQLLNTYQHTMAPITYRHVFETMAQRGVCLVSPSRQAVELRFAASPEWLQSLCTSSWYIRLLRTFALLKTWAIQTSAASEFSNSFFLSASFNFPLDLGFLPRLFLPHFPSP